jgi:hypothetical protein
VENVSIPACEFQELLDFFQNMAQSFTLFEFVSQMFGPNVCEYIESSHT